MTWKDMPAKHGNYPTGSHTNLGKLIQTSGSTCLASGNGLLLKQTSSEHASEHPQTIFRKLSNKYVPKSQKDLRFFSNLHLEESDQNSSRNLSDFSRHSKDYSLRSFETASSGKLSTIRKDDIHNTLRSQHQFDCGNTK